MKATKKQIENITNAAIKSGIEIHLALKVLDSMSKRIFDCIGIEGLIKTCNDIKVQESVGNGNVAMNIDMIIGNTEKAYLISYNGREKWVAKSLIKIINGTSCFPSWVLNK